MIVWLVIGVQWGCCDQHDVDAVYMREADATAHATLGTRTTPGVPFDDMIVESREVL